MTTPLLPEVADLDTFGGVFVDADPVVDPETDMAASYQNRINAQLAAASHTQPRAWARCTISGGVITLADHDAVWGSGAGVAPTAVYSATGVYTVTWAAAYDDLQDTPEEHAVSLRAAVATGYAGTSARIVCASCTSAVVATVRAWDAAGTAADLTEFTVQVF
jgi:hypothetical protein